MFYSKKKITTFLKPKMPLLDSTLLYRINDSGLFIFLDVSKYKVSLNRDNICSNIGFFKILINRKLIFFIN